MGIYCTHVPVLDDNGFWVCDKCGVKLAVIELEN